MAAGDVTLGVVAIPAVMPHLKSGKIKIIGRATATRTDFDKSWIPAREGGGYSARIGASLHLRLSPCAPVLADT
jgi:tripartite-type tricarboxylate transporter receptor subunit TctC